MRRTFVVALLATLALTSCAATGTESQLGQPVRSASVAPTPAVQPSPSPQVAAIDVALLPPQGVVVSSRHGVAFVGLDGRLITRVSHFGLYYEWTVPGPVILRHHRVYYLLDVRGHRLEPVGSRDAAFPFAPQFQEGLEGLPLPHGVTRDDGFWTYALTAPDGSALLEQWSGECEVPTAFLAAPDGSDPRPVTGAWGLRHAGESIALGWTSDSRAVVNIFSSPCGNGMRRPGVYLVDSPGHGELIYAFTGSARMWGTA